MTEQLWAPWRLKYIESADKAQGCIFCDLPARDPAQDAESLIVHRGPHAFIMLNAFPYSNGHLMVVPYQHTATFDTFTDAEMLDVMRLTRLSIQLLRAVIRPDGFNLGVNMGRVAGAGIADHLHGHIVPRWNGDTNFMPVVGDTKVLSEHMLATYKKLLPAFVHLNAPDLAHG
jgi:ATP adenylyltransferase